MFSYSRNYEVGSMGLGAGLCMYDVVVKKFTFAVSSLDQFLCFIPKFNNFRYSNLILMN